MEPMCQPPWRAGPEGNGHAGCWHMSMGTGTPGCCPVFDTPVSSVKAPLHLHTPPQALHPHPNAPTCTWTPSPCPHQDPNPHPDPPTWTPGLRSMWQPPCDWAVRARSHPPGPTGPGARPPLLPPFLHPPPAWPPWAAPGPGRDEPRPELPTDMAPRRPLQGPPCPLETTPSPHPVDLAACHPSSG